MSSVEIAQSGAIKAFWHQGETEFLLVTFNDMGMASTFDGQNYWGRRFIEKNDITALGFVTTQKDWFNPSDMEDLADQLLHVLTEYRTVICYGYSMGGYAALRFSGLLGASHVLAVGPQASINPEDVAHFDKRYIRNFGSGGHRIQPRHIGGQVWVAYDPCYAMDAGQVDMITEAVPSARLIHTPYMGHGVMNAFVGSENAQAIIRGVIANDFEGVTQRVRQKRKANWLYHYTLVQAAALRRPEQALARLNSDPRLRRMPAPPRVNALVRVLLSLGRTGEALDEALRLIARFPNHATWHVRTFMQFLNSGLHSEAQSVLREALSRKPEAPQLIYHQERVLRLARAGKLVII